MKAKIFGIILSFATLLILNNKGVNATHIDDVDGELSNFSFDRVVMRLQKDCSLDKMPDVSRIFLLHSITSILNQSTRVFFLIF